MTFDRESCVLYKQALDEHLPAEGGRLETTFQKFGMPSKVRWSAKLW